MGARKHACDPGSSDCIIRLSHSDSENVEIELIREPAGVPAFSFVDEADLRDWGFKLLNVALTNTSKYLKLISLSDIKVDGLRAIRRLYEYPMVDPASSKVTAIQSNYQVLVLKVEDLYYIHLYTTNSIEFNKYIAFADGIVNSIVFQK